jgi:hypothetical protein
VLQLALLMVPVLPWPVLSVSVVPLPSSKLQWAINPGNAPGGENVGAAHAPLMVYAPLVTVLSL